MISIDVSSVLERDIDLLLVELLADSPQFFDWFLSRLGLDADAELLAVEHSVTTQSGESDLEVTFRRGKRAVKLLIENKLGAAFQPRQSERYRERGEQYVRRGDCDAFHTVLVAPASYFGEDETTCGFDHCITLDEVLNWVEQANSFGELGEYKITLIRSALERGSSGWQLVPDEAVTRFWQEYWKLASSDAPELRMPRPGPKPAISNFIYFRPRGLPPDAKLIHKVLYGHVDIQFAGRAEDIDALEREYSGILEEGMHIQRAGKSAVIRMCVPEMDMTAPFAESLPHVRQSLAAATQLLNWHRRHKG